MDLLVFLQPMSQLPRKKRSLGWENFLKAQQETKPKERKNSREMLEEMDRDIRIARTGGWPQSPR